MTEEEDTFETDLLKASGNDFFKLLEQQLKTTIPNVVKNSLLFSEYSCAVVLAQFDDASINSIENDLKNNLSAEMLLEEESMETYLGRFVKCQEKFKFMDGHRKWFKIIADTCRMLLGKSVPSESSASTKPNEPSPLSEAHSN